MARRTASSSPRAGPVVGALEGPASWACATTAAQTHAAITRIRVHRHITFCRITGKPGAFHGGVVANGACLNRCMVPSSSMFLLQAHHPSVYPQHASARGCRPISDAQEPLAQASKICLG